VYAYFGYEVRLYMADAGVGKTPVRTALGLALVSFLPGYSLSLCFFREGAIYAGYNGSHSVLVSGIAVAPPIGHSY